MFERRFFATNRLVVSIIFKILLWEMIQLDNKSNDNPKKHDISEQLYMCIDILYIHIYIYIYICTSLNIHSTRRDFAAIFWLPSLFSLRLAPSLGLSRPYVLGHPDRQWWKMVGRKAPKTSHVGEKSFFEGSFFVGHFEGQFFCFVMNWH